MSLAGGAVIFGAFLVIFTVAVIYSLYTRRGSGINQRPYNNPYGGANGAKWGSVLHHDESAATRYTRGTRAGSYSARNRKRLDVGRPTSEAAEKIFTRD